MAIERQFFGPERKKGPGWLIGVVTAPWHHSLPIRTLHLAREILHMSHEHGGPLLDVIKGHRSITEIALNKEQFLAQYLQMGYPDKPMNIQEEGRVRQIKVSSITEWAQWNAQKTLSEIQANTQTSDIPSIAYWMNGILSQPEVPVYAKKRRHQERVNQLRRDLTRVRTVLAGGIVHDATLATAEQYYSMMEELHLDGLMNDINTMAVGAGAGLLTAGALAALGLMGPMAVPAGAIAGVIAENVLHNTRTVKIMSEDGSKFDSYRYAFSDKDRAQIVLQYADMVSEFMKLSQVPEGLVSKGRKSQEDMVRRSFALASATIATMPNYYRLVHRLQAYALFTEILKEKGLQKH